MKRVQISGLLLVAFVVLMSQMTFGGKKPKRPVLERYSGRVTPYKTGGDSALSKNMGENDNQGLFVKMNDDVDVSIQEFTSDQEAQTIAQSFRDGGENGLEKVMKKLNKGYFKIGNGSTSQILYVTAAVEGSVRKLSIIGKGPSSFSSSPGESMTLPQIPHTYTFIGLRSTNKGKGRAC
jgi:hypothetical protein